MLPKIAVGVFENRDKFLKFFSLKTNTILGYEGKEAQLSELRSWITNSIGILSSHSKYTMIIWDADLMSKECQAVLLKPMEELETDMSLILTAENENKLLSTILSRGEVIKMIPEEKNGKSFWDEVRKCWSSGPAACIALTDSLDKEDAIVLLDELIRKLQTGLLTEINEKRLMILDSAITALAEIRETNINTKLLLDNFLISSWKMIKA